MMTVTDLFLLGVLTSVMVELSVGPRDRFANRPLPASMDMVELRLLSEVSDMVELHRTHRISKRY